MGAVLTGGTAMVYHTQTTHACTLQYTPHGMRTRYIDIVTVRTVMHAAPSKYCQSAVKLHMCTRAQDSNTVTHTHTHTHTHTRSSRESAIFSMYCMDASSELRRLLPAGATDAPFESSMFCAGAMYGGMPSVARTCGACVLGPFMYYVNGS